MSLPAFLPLLIAAAAALLFALGNRRAEREIGHSPDVFGSSDSALDFLGRTHRVVFAISIAGLALHAVMGVPGAGAWAALGWLGAAVMLAGGACMAWAQHAMGTAWRIGIDAAPTALVLRGPFTSSRNPTFLGMVMVLAGGAIAAPNLLTAAALGGGIVAFGTQIRLEEAHLAALHGEAYRAYAGRVGRWLGWRA